MSAISSSRSLPACARPPSVSRGRRRRRRRRENRERSSRAPSPAAGAGPRGGVGAIRRPLSPKARETRVRRSWPIILNIRRARARGRICPARARRRSKRARGRNFGAGKRVSKENDSSGRVGRRARLDRHRGHGFYRAAAGRRPAQVRASRRVGAGRPRARRGSARRGGARPGCAGAALEELLKLCWAPGVLHRFGGVRVLSSRARSL